MKVFNKIALTFLIGTSFSFGQTDVNEQPYISYKYHPIVFNDIGFSDAPANIKYPFNDQISKIQLRHNNKIMLGIGFSYNWISFRVGAALIGNFKPVSQYGRSRYIDVGTQFSIKRVYAEADLRSYNGYVVENAFRWDPNYSLENPHDKEQNLNVTNIALKMWYLHNRNFRMDPFTGNRGVYNKQVMTWYIAARLDFNSISNLESSIVPLNLIDTLNSKTAAQGISSIELGAIPGYAYVNKVKNFQFGFMAAAGPRIQVKSYQVNDQTTSLTSIVARYDVKVIMGYNVPRFFAMLHLEADSKSIHFSNFKYNQNFFYLKVQTGYRFKERLPKKLRKQENQK